MPLEERRGQVLHHPGQVRTGECQPEAVQGGERADHVPHRAEPDHEDPVGAPERCDGALHGGGMLTGRREPVRRSRCAAV
jgi:hypothetical protein